MNPLQNRLDKGSDRRGRFRAILFILLFPIVSILLHLLVLSGITGFGDSLLAGLGRAAREEVVSFLIADNPPSHPVKSEISSVTARPEPRTKVAPDASPSGKTVAKAAAPDETEAEEEPAEPAAENRTGEAERESAPAPAHDTPVPHNTPTQAAQSANAGPGGSTVAEDGRGTAGAGKTPVPDILPFTRERLVFSLYWSGINVGTAVLEAVRDGEVSTISSEVHSNAVISAFYKVEDYAEARLVKGRATRFKLLQNEGRHHRNRETIFDMERDRVIYVNHLSHSQKEFEMNGKLLWDVITGFYYLRRQPLETGSSVYVNMFDSSKFLNAEVKVLRRSTAELEDGRQVSTIIVEPIIKTEGLFQKSGSIRVWLTDDERRMPVRMETEVKFGRITAKLTSFSVVN